MGSWFEKHCHVKAWPKYASDVDKTTSCADIQQTQLVEKEGQLQGSMPCTLHRFNTGSTCANRYSHLSMYSCAHAHALQIHNAQPDCCQPDDCNQMTVSCKGCTHRTTFTLQGTSTQPYGRMNAQRATPAVCQNIAPGLQICCTKPQDTPMTSGTQ